MGKTHRQPTRESAVKRDLFTAKYRSKVERAGRGDGSYRRSDAIQEIDEYMADNSYDEYISDE